jgi:hypothetical protein
MQPGDAAVMIPAARAATMRKLRLMGFIILIISLPPNRRPDAALMEQSYHRFAAGVNGKIWVVS